MSTTSSGSFEAFLVEDMILTLANLRASLDWLSGASGGTGAHHRAGWGRFDRQLEMLEARARDLLQGERERALSTPASAAAQPMAPCEDEDDIDNIFLMAPEEAPFAAIFQSRRHGA